METKGHRRSGLIVEAPRNYFLQNILNIGSKGESALQTSEFPKAHDSSSSQEPRKDAWTCHYHPGMGWRRPGGGNHIIRNDFSGLSFPSLSSLFYFLGNQKRGKVLVVI